jgi:hypothetical protein
MSKTFAPRAVSIAAAALLTLAMVSGANTLALNAYRSASVAQLQSTPMAVAQHVTVVAHRTARA